MSTTGNWRGPNIVKDGLVLYLDAGSPNSYYSQSGGVTWKDISGNGNNGTLTNGPTYSSLNGGSIVFDGVDDYVNLNNSTPLQTGTSNFTWSVWIKTPGSFGGYKMILSSDVYYAYLSLDNNQIAYHNPSNGLFRFGTLLTNTWYNITIVKNNNIVYGYINGIFISSANDTFNMSGNFNIGRWNYNNTLYYNSNMTTIQVYNKSLSASEVLQNYNATKSRFGL